jgi:hypothetical protein
MTACEARGSIKVELSVHIVGDPIFRKLLGTGAAHQLHKIIHAVRLPQEVLNPGL